MRGHGRRRTLCALCTTLLGALVWVSPAAANSIGVGDVEVTEGAGTVNATFALTRLASGLSGPTSVSFSTVAGSASTAVDFAAASGSRDFGSSLFGATQTHYVVVTVQADALDEPSESFRLVVSGAEVTDGDATATILDDDPPPALRVAGSATVSEGAPAAQASFVVHLSSASGRQVSVDYATADAGATAGQDYVARSGTLVLAAGVTQAAVDVEMLDDGADEPPEGFELRLSRPRAATLGDAAASATILDDDEPAPPPPPQAPPPPPPPSAGGGSGSSPALPAPATSGSTAGSPTSTGSGGAGRPSLGLSSPRLKRPSTVLVTVSCPQGGDRCAGRVTIFTIPNRRSKIVALRLQRRLGRRTFTLAGGRARTLQIALGRPDRRLLNRTGRIRVRAYAVTQDSAGRSGVRTVNGTLVARTAHSSLADR